MLEFGCYESRVCFDFEDSRLQFSAIELIGLINVRTRARMDGQVIVNVIMDMNTIRCDSRPSDFRPYSSVGYRMILTGDPNQDNHR